MSDDRKPERRTSVEGDRVAKDNAIANENEADYSADEATLADQDEQSNKEIAAIKGDDQTVKEAQTNGSGSDSNITQPPVYDTCDRHVEERPGTGRRPWLRNWNFQQGIRWPGQTHHDDTYGSTNQYRWNCFQARPDRQTRTTALALIGDIMSNEELGPDVVLSILQDLENACKKDSVPFSELLYENVDKIDLPPLLLEILRCDWRVAADLLEYLAITTKGPKVDAMIRQGCHVRGDNELFQFFRVVLDQKPAYQVTIEENEQGFLAAASVEELFEELSDCLDYRTAFDPELLGQDYRRSKVVQLDWLVQGRTWSLEIDNDILSLSLIDGEPASVWATVMVDGEHTESSRKGACGSEDTPTSFEVDFPPNSAIYPMSGKGGHKIDAQIPWNTKTCRPLSWWDILSKRPAVTFTVAVQVAAIKSANASSQEKLRSGIDEEDWEDVERSEDGDWVLASWQGKDRDEDEATLLL